MYVMKYKCIDYITADCRYFSKENQHQVVNYIFQIIAFINELFSLVL